MSTLRVEWTDDERAEVEVRERARREQTEAEALPWMLPEAWARCQNKGRSYERCEVCGCYERLYTSPTTDLKLCGDCYLKV
jgi:ribosomal protein S14